MTGFGSELPTAAGWQAHHLIPSELAATGLEQDRPDVAAARVASREVRPQMKPGLIDARHSRVIVLQSEPRLQHCAMGEG